MSGRKIFFYSSFLIAFLVIAGIPSKHPLAAQDSSNSQTLMAGRNVNMVSGTTLPDGDPWLQRQNEPSIAVSTRNPSHLLAGANDYRTVDYPLSEGELPGKLKNQPAGDAWLGVFKSFDGGQSWISTLLPGFPQDDSPEGVASPLKGYRAAADPVVRAGANGLFFYSGIVFDRTESGKSAVFVARFIDNNNDEEGDPIQHVDTRIIDELDGGRFKDKPWIAVDLPKKNAASINISGQNIPRSNVYIVYSVFEGEGEAQQSKILFRRSTDCGATWEAPIELSTGHLLNQGATIAVDPRGNGHIFVAWRRFSSDTGQSGAIVIARSTNYGKEFPDVVEVADVPGPFDQPTLSADDPPIFGTAFRTNSYPTMTIDSKGRIYLAWSQRGMESLSPNDSRVVIATSKDGFTWTTPMTIEGAIMGASGSGCHEFMPTIAFAGGRLILAWYDTRNDCCLDNAYPQWICDPALPDTIRHTVDVRVAEGILGEFPVFQPSVQASRYLWAMFENGSGNYYFRQVQFNPPNYPLFKGGIVPFHGDYIDIAPSPALVQSSKGVWRFNTEPTDSQQFHLAWTDNRDVRPPEDNNWEIYNPPAISQPLSQPKFFSSTLCVDEKRTGMRNQNVYTSCITSVMEAGAPGNNKPLGTLGTNPATGEMIPRAFVIFVKNPTEDIRHYRLQIMESPAYGTASFLEFDMLEEIDVSIAPYSSISRPLFVTSSNQNDTVTIDVFEIDEPGGSPIAGGAKSTIVINPDETSPDVSGGLANTESHEPVIENPNIVNWTYVNPNIVNPNIVNPNIVNPNIVNPNIVNPNIVNPNIVNPNIVNPNIVNPNIVNPNIVNPNIVNPNIVNSSIADADVTDVEWNVRNAGNTLSSYTFKIFARESLPKGIYAQLVVYKVHYAPATDGENCALKQTPHHELLLNVLNPNIVNPNIVNPNIVNPNIVNSAIENATFFLAPGEEAKAVLRLIDPEPGEAKFLQSGKKFKIQSFAESLGAASSSQAVDSDDAQQGDTTADADSTELIIITSALPDGTVGIQYPITQLEASGGDGTYYWSVNSQLLPPGIGFTNSGLISGIPQNDPNVTYPHIYSFIVQVSSGSEVDTQNLSITINSAEQPTPPLDITTTSLPNGTKGNYYGATLQAVGGVPPRLWSLVSGALPLGLTLDSGGVISGTIQNDPNVSYPHIYSFVVKATGFKGSSDTQPLSITVNEFLKPDLTISGTIKTQGGAAISGVNIYGLPHAPKTDSYGFYCDNVPYGWSGTITPFKAGYTFRVSAGDPSPSRTYQSITQDQLSQNFVGSTINYTISGTVTFYGSPLAGVTMNGLPGNPVTNAAGYYSAAVPHGWSGTVTPALLDYIFDPPSRTYASITSDFVNQYYTATFVGVGTDDPFEDNDNLNSATSVTDGNYTNMQLHDDDWYRVNVAQGSDLKVAVTGNLNKNIDLEIYDSLGARIIGAYGSPQNASGFASNLPAGWTYIRVIYLGTTGFWNSYDLSVQTGSGLGNGGITGRVTNCLPEGLENVEITLHDTQSDNYFATATDLNGDYRISLSPSSYKLFFDASLVGSPNYVSEYYDNKLTFENADLIVVQSGVVIVEIDAVLDLESVLSVVTAALPGGNLATPYSTQLEAAGGTTPYQWALASGFLPDGLVLHSDGVIDGTPSGLGTYSFTVQVTDTSSPTPQTAAKELSITISTYAGTDYVISGTVILNGSETPLSGVVMNGLPGNPATDSSGAYSAYVYSGWTGTVTPILSGYSFTPASRPYTDVTTNFTAQNYTASTGYTISGEVTLGGSPLEGVVMSGLPGNPQTDENGHYSGAVPSGWEGTVIPILPGFSFDPANIHYTNVTSNQINQSYTANYQGGQDDTYENNNDLASAAELTLGTHANLVLADVDWFKIYIPSGNEDKDLKINLKAQSYPDPNGYKDLDLSIVSESGKMLGYTLSSSDDETLYLANIKEGYYYFGQTYISQPGTVYSLTVELSDNFGIGYVSGRVTDEITGQPIEGIYVELCEYPGDWAKPWPLLTTDANGEYKIGFTPGNYTVRFNQYAFNEPYAPDLNYIYRSYNSNEIFSVVAGSTITGIDMQLKPGGMITGRIMDAAGNGLPDGWAFVYSSDRAQVANSYVNIDENGNYWIKRLPTGNYKVRARTGIKGSMWYDGMGSFDGGDLVAVKEGMTTPNIDFRLDDSAIIQGRVTDSDQNPIQNVTVYAYDLSGISLWSGGTNADGYYWIGHRLPTGEVKLFFDAGGAQGNYASEYYTDKLLIEDADPVSVQAGQTTSNIDAVLAEGGRISGRVTDAQDDGFPGVAVHCVDIDSDRYYSATTNADGYYTIGGLQPDEYKVRLRTTYGDYATQWYSGKFSFSEGDVISVAAGANKTDINAKLTNNGGFISGRVTDMSGNGIKDIQVVAQDASIEAAMSWTLSDNDGYYTLPRIPTCNAKVFFDADLNFLNYSSEWYNDSSTHAGAATVAVTFSQETTGIDAILASIPPVNIMTTSLSNGEVAAPYEVALEAAGGREFYDWSLISGALPPGLTLDSKGEITGIPQTSGDYSFTVRVTDSCRNQQLIDTQTLNLTIAAYSGSGYLISGSVTFSGSPLPGVVMQGLPGNPMTAANGEYVVGVDSGWSGVVAPKKAGFYFDPSKRTYTGVNSNRTGQNYAAYEQTLNITTNWLLNGTEGYPYSQNLQVEGGTQPYTWSVSSGLVPYGLTLNSNGTISGTPAHSRNYNFTVRVTDSSSPVPQVGEKDLSIFIHGNSVTEAPILYWKLDEGSGTRALDSSGRGVDGLLNGSISYTGDAVGGLAADIFANGWIEKETPWMSSHFADEATIMAYIKIDDFNLPERFIWDLRYDNPFIGHPNSLEIYLKINGNLLHLDSANGLMEGLENCPHFQAEVDLSDPASVFELGLYNQIAVAIKDNTYTIFINGNQVASAIGAPFRPHDSIQNFWVGGADWSNFFLGGQTDEILAFNKNLNLQEVEECFTAGPMYLISGSVHLDGSPFPWVQMNGLPGNPQANENGEYTAPVLPGWSGTVTPNWGGYYFVPASRTYANVSEDFSEENFQAFAGGSLWITTDWLPDGTKNQAYEVTLEAADGIEPYSWSVISGLLPDGLNLNSGTGMISGTPTEAGNFNFTVQVTDSNEPQQGAVRDLTISITPEHEGFWTTTFPPGGNIRPLSLVLDPSDSNTIYAGANWRGMYKSINGGGSWENLTDAVENPPFNRTNTQIFMVRPSQNPGNPNELYLASDGQILVSYDDGASWESRSEGLSGHVQLFSFHPTQHNRLFVLTQNPQLEDNGLYKTEDGGLSWSRIDTGLPAAEMMSLSIDPSDPDVMYIGTWDFGIYKSTDGGSEWINSNGNIDFSSVVDIAVDPSNSDVIYLAGCDDLSGRGLYQSVDGGVTWVRLPGDCSPVWYPGQHIAIDPNNTDIIYATSWQSVFKSEDAGDNWSEAYVANCFVIAIVLDPTSGVDPLNDRTLYAATETEGVFKSIDSGQTWTAVNNGIDARNFPHSSAHSLKIDRSNPNNLYAGAIGGGFRSTDTGQTWTRIDIEGSNWNIQSFAVDPASQNNIYAYCGNLYKSTNFGADWISISTEYLQGLGDGDLVIAPSDPSILYLSTKWSEVTPDGIHKSTDGGSNWTLVNNGLPNYRFRTMAVHPTDPNIVFAGAHIDWSHDPGMGQALYKTDDGGANWNVVSCGLPDIYCVNQIIFSQSDPEIVYMIAECENGGIYKSIDGGECWTKLLGENANAGAVSPDDPNLVYLGTWNTGGFYVSLNGGGSWMQFNEGLPPNPGIETIALDSDNPYHVFIGTTGGVYEATFSFDFMITTDGLPSGIVGEPYNATLEAAGGVGDYSWQVVSGSLPDGLGLDSDTGVISGTPPVAGSWNFSVKCTDSSSSPKTFTRAFNITIHNVYTLTVASNPALGGSVTKSPDEPRYLEGMTVDVSVMTNGTYTFTGWSGDASGTAALVHVQMTKNKAITANFALTTDLPDYVVDSFTLPSAAGAGDVIGGSVAVTVENQGAGDGYSGDISVGIYLSPDPVIATTDTLLWKGRSSLTALSGGGSTGVAIDPELQIPTTVSSGSYYIGVLVDESGVVAERDETNNDSSQAINITSTPYDHLELLGMWHGGTSDAVACDASRNLALTGHGSVLEILDVSNIAHPVKIGELALGTQGICDIKISGNYAYIAGDGLRIVDITYPTNPTEVGSNQIPYLARGLVLSGDYVFLTDHFYQGLRVFNVSDPSDPVEVNFTPFPQRTRGIARSGNYLYLQASIWIGEGETGIRVVNITDPENPWQENFYPTSISPGWPEVSGNYLYLPTSGGGLYVLDISDPAHPSQAAFYGDVQNSGWIKIVGDYAYLNDNNRNAVSVLNISDLNNIHEVGVHYFEDQNSVNFMDVLGHYCFADGWYHSLKILDMSNPENPYEIGSYEGYEGILNDVDVSGNYAHITSYKSNGESKLRTLDISNPSAISEVGAYLNPTFLYQVRRSGDVACVLTGDNKLKIFDVSDPAHPLQVGVFEDLDNVYDLEVSGNYAFVADHNIGLKIIDISTPSNPVHVSTWYTPSSAFAVSISGNFAYVSARWRGLRIVDISDPLNPYEVGAYETENMEFRAFEVEVCGNYAFVEDLNYNLRIIDITDPQNPLEVSTFITNCVDILDIKVSGHVVFIGTYVNGMMVIDVSDPSNPVKIDEYPTFEAVSIAIKENRIYEVDRSSGLLVYEFRRQ
jgi:photosystem II stability/assembly factor-like uncharacterized protein